MTKEFVLAGVILSLLAFNASASSCDPVADAKSATPDMPVTLEKDVDILTSTGGGNMYLGTRLKKGTKLTSAFRTNNVPKGEHVLIEYTDPSCGWTKKKVLYMEDVWKSIGQAPAASRPAQ